MTASRKGLLLVVMEPPSALEDEFNDWYDTEHFPQRRALPGFETASRWVCLSGWPRWLAIYDLASTSALRTPEYAAVSGTNSTPWSLRILPRTIGRLRVVAEQVDPGDAPARPVAEVARVCLAQYPATGHPAAGRGDAGDLARRCGDLDGFLQLRLFREEAGLWALAEFDRPVSMERITPEFEAVAGVGAKLLNLYAPYRRS